MARAKREQTELATLLRAEGALWADVAAEFAARWSLNARQAIRLARGWSQQDVADEWNHRWPNARTVRTAKNISTWECWPQSGHEPSLAVLDRLARIYGCSVADLVSDLGDYGFDIGAGRADDPGVDRRTLLVGLGGSVATAAFRPRWPDRANPDTLDYLDAQLRGHWKADRTFGPHVVLDTAAAQCSVALRCVEVTQGALHRRALELATAFTGLLGWLYQDAGNLTACGRWLDTTLELAHRTGDPHLIAYALTCKAMVRVDVGDGRAALDLTTAALAATELTPKAKAMALQQAALAHALLGNRAGVDRRLDEVGLALEAMADEGQPWGGDRLQRGAEHVVDVQRATCYGRLGLHDEAAGLWERVGRDAAPAERRDLGVYHARHAAAFVSTGAIVEAAPLARLAVDGLRQTGSARLAGELTRLRALAEPWALTRAGRDLHGALATD